MSSSHFKWLEECPRRVMIGLHIPDYDQLPEYADLEKHYNLSGIMANYDPEKMVKKLKEADAQAFWFYNKGHMGNAYYPTKVGHMHSALNGRDVFAETIEACQKHRITPLCVYEASDCRISRDKKEWCHNTVFDGERDITDVFDGASGGACILGPYGDFIMEQAVETVSSYSLKGYYVDFLGLFAGDKWSCPYCQKKIADDLNWDMEIFEPGAMSSEQLAAFTNWRYEKYAEFALKMKTAIQKASPQTLFTHNFHCGSLQNPEKASEICDIVTGDIFHLRAGMLSISWGAKRYAELSKNHPSDMLIDSDFSYNMDFSTIKAIDSFRVETLTARSSGIGLTSAIIPDITGYINDEQFNILKKIFSEQKKYEDYWRNMKPLADVGIIRSENTAAFMKEKFNGSDSVVKYDKHETAFEGWCQTVICNHNLWDIVSEHNLNENRLSRFKTLVLPNCASLSDLQAQSIRQWVKDGGTLIATANSGLFNENAEPRTDFVLSDVFGVSKAGDFRSAYRYAKFDKKLLPEDKPWCYDIMNFSEGQVPVKSLPGTEVLAKVFYMPEVPGIIVKTFIETEYPALIHNKFGDGQCFYFAGLPGLQYRAVGQNNIKEMLKIILDSGRGNDLFKYNGSETVEVFAHFQGENRSRLIITLINSIQGQCRNAGLPSYSRPRSEYRSPVRFEEIEQMPEITGGEIVFNENVSISGVFSVDSREELTCENNKVIIDKLKVHKMIIVELDSE
ncbi:MAG: beta-galactosidase trimerization domain-containing protein [Planctomycetota bacterium]|jgi:hypothetical protein